MDQRLELHQMLADIMDEVVPENRTKVFFQPPASVYLTYPCIIYQLSKIDPVYADNGLYKSTRGYQVTVIDRNPDSVIPAMVEKLPYCKFDRYFVIDNLNHYIFTIYH